MTRLQSSESAIVQASTASGRERVLEARYGEEPALPGHAWNEVLATILAHRSVRAFSRQPVPPETLPLLVAAAQSAPTSSNTQSWSVVSVSDPDTRKRLAAIAGDQRHVEEAPLFLAFIADLARADAIGRAAGVELAALDYTEAFLIAAIDAALAAQNAATAAESLGLGTVYIGALRNKPEEVAALLRLPRRAMAVFGLCVGHERGDAGTEVKPRLAQDAVLHVEHYDATGLEAAVARYEARNDAFRARQQLAPIRWADQLMDRWRDQGALKGRHRLFETLVRLGFPFR